MQEEGIRQEEKNGKRCRIKTEEDGVKRTERRDNRDKSK